MYLNVAANLLLRFHSGSVMGGGSGRGAGRHGEGRKDGGTGDGGGKGLTEEGEGKRGGGGGQEEVWKL